MLEFFASRKAAALPHCIHLKEFGFQSVIACPWGRRSRTDLGTGGDSHEEIGFVSNGADNDIGLGSCGGHGLEGGQGAGGGSVRAVGSGLRQRDYERLHLPR